MNVPKVIQPVTMAMGQMGLRLRKHAPEIMTGCGIFGYGLTVVEGCKASTKLTPVLDAHSRPEDRDILAKELVRLYGPTVALFAASTGLVLGGFGILNGRFASATAAYAALEEGFTMYRDRVREDLGEEADRKYRYGIAKTKDIQENADGSMSVVESDAYRQVTAKNPNGYSIYARIFDEANPNWSKDPMQNLIFVKSKLNYANDLLHARGYLFLSEVYKELGFDEDKASRIVGWIVKPGNDNYVDFGIYDILNDRTNAFINGYERNVILDFNVDGVIFDQI